MINTVFLGTGFYVPDRVVTNRDLALDAAGLKASDIDAIILATLAPLSSDHSFPGTSAFLQAELGLPGVPALDVRTQCTGFIYGLSIADAWIRSGQYRTILLVGVEIQSTGLDLSTKISSGTETQRRRAYPSPWRKLSGRGGCPKKISSVWWRSGPVSPGEALWFGGDS